jgi:arsenate reductase (glutaredoxin)
MPSLPVLHSPLDYIVCSAVESKPDHRSRHALAFAHFTLYNDMADDTNNLNSSSARIYGIKNCDTMKKAFTWFNDRNIPYHFHDYKKMGVPRDELVAWCRSVGWKSLINTKGPTWRKLTPEQQDITTQSKAVTIMMEFSSVIRRPIVVTREGQILVGFDPVLFESFVRL